MSKLGLSLVLVLTFLQSLILLTSAAQESVKAVAVFNSRGVTGNITFSQANAEAPTVITAYLKGLNNIAGSPSFQWHVHDYPFPNDGNPSPCGSLIVGGHYDPLGAIENPSYSTLCNTVTPQNCEIGDLSGKFGNFPAAETVFANYSDDNLDLLGVYSIIDRSIVIHFENTSRFVCANVADSVNTVSTNSTRLLYSPFRNNFAGNIFFRQHAENKSSALVYTTLALLDGNVNSSSGHNWHVHETALDEGGTDCGLAGPHYNPRGVSVTPESGYPTRCGNSSITMQRECEIGDLSNKGGPFNINNRATKQLYTDTDLPLFRNADGYEINGRSIVIHEENLGGPRIACANLTTYQPLEAVSRFSESGVTGSIQFYQHSPYDPIQVIVNLKGLRSMASGYHVHAYPVGPGTSPARCSNMYAGGHWNPHGITEAGTTSDQFEIGDLSGKFGNLAGQNDFYREYTDPNIPLFGPYSIIGRSIVIHLDDADGTRWVCSDIQRVARVVQVTTTISNNALSGRVIFFQPADDPYAETTVVVEISVTQDIPLTANSDGFVQYRWSYRQAGPSSQENCDSLSYLDLFSSNIDLCGTTQQLACRVGDLSGKHGDLLIPQAAGSVFRAVYTDTNFPLSNRPGLDVVFSGSRTGRLYIAPAASSDSTNAICAQSAVAATIEAPTIDATPTDEAPTTDATPTDGTPSLTQLSSVMLFSISLVYIVSSVLSW